MYHFHLTSGDFLFNTVAQRTVSAVLFKMRHETEGKETEGKENKCY